MEKTRYERAIAELAKTGSTKMKCFGNSMLPILNSGDLLKFEARPEYEVGDIVFCRVRGRYIDAHRVTARGDRGYLIANNRGHENGWTNRVFGKVVEAEGRKI
jgi:SOS-response transcriptional repressor LexA